MWRRPVGLRCYFPKCLLTIEATLKPLARADTKPWGDDRVCLEGVRPFPPGSVAESVAAVGEAKPGALNWPGGRSSRDAAPCAVHRLCVLRASAGRAPGTRERHPQEGTWRNTHACTHTPPAPSVSRPCRHSLAQAVQQHPHFRALFNFSQPVLLAGGLFSQELWDSLSQRRAPYGWQGLPRQDIASTLSLLNSSESAQLLGSREPRGDCVRCAVVGNGGILNGSRQGPNIDAHDYVFRLNGAVIKGFEQDVGTKTSFYGFTVNTMKNSLIAYSAAGFTSVPQGPDLRYIFIPSGLRDYVMLRSAVLGVPVPSGHDKGDRPRTYFGPEAPASKFKLLHPAFISYLTERFLKSKRIISKFKDIYMPSTGALMLLTALHTCDQVSAYGFITSNYWKFSDHYYDRVKQPLIFYANHDLPLEAELWWDLHKAGILQLYQHPA